MGNTDVRDGMIPSEEARWAFVRLLPVLVVLVVFSLTLTSGSATTTDSGPIIAAAHRILQGRYAVTGTTDATKFLWHGPGLPALLAPLVALGTPGAVLRLTSPLLMFAAVLLLYRLLRFRLGRPSALAGAYFLGLYGPGYYVLPTIAKDPLALACAILALDGTARYLQYGRPRHALIAGLSFAALAMTRLEYGWVLTAALAATLGWWLTARLRQRGGGPVTCVPRRFALICGVAMVACLPWLVYTYSLTRHVLYWGNSGGISLYWMSVPSPSQLGEWHAWHSVFTAHALAAYRPLFRHLGTLSPLQQDLAFKHLAFVQAVGHPAKYALNLLANLGRMFLGFPFSFTLMPALFVGLVVFNGTLLAGMTASVVAIARGRLPVPPETGPFLLFAALALAVHVFPSSEPRMLLPILPVGIWLAGQAADLWQPAFARIGTALAMRRATAQASRV